MEFHKKQDTGGKEKMSKLYYHEFKVKGSYYFPMDMLRYDCCWPKSSGDVDGLVNVKEERVIYLAAIGHKDWRPTIKRWESFNWTCTYVERGIVVS